MGDEVRSRDSTVATPEAVMPAGRVTKGFVTTEQGRFIIESQRRIII
jgi:hypothetical protein